MTDTSRADRGRASKAAASRRGRTAVLLGLACFVGLQLAFHYPLSYLCPQLHDVEYANKLSSLRTHLRTRSTDVPLILALGSSFTGMGVRPAAMLTGQAHDEHGPLIYNYGMNSGGVLVQLLCLHRLLAEGIRPDWVVIEASPYFLFRNPNLAQENEFLAIPRVQRCDMSILARYHANPHQLRKDWRAAQCSPWFSHRHLVQNWLLPSWIPESKRIDHLWCHTDEWGWEAFPAYIEQYKSVYQTPEWIRKQQQWMESMNQQPLDEGMQRAFLELVATCQRENIGVVLVRVPESTYIRTAYAPTVRRGIEQFYTQLRQATGASVVDASAWVADADFVEGMHLAPAGATTYSQRLEQDVLIPIAAAHSARARGLTALRDGN